MRQVDISARSKRVNEAAFAVCGERKGSGRRGHQTAWIVDGTQTRNGKLCGAADGTRTRNNQLGRLRLYQLNYRRLFALKTGASAPKIPKAPRVPSSKASTLTCF